MSADAARCFIDALPAAASPEDELVALVGALTESATSADALVQALVARGLDARVAAEVADVAFAPSNAAHPGRAYWAQFFMRVRMWPEKIVGLPRGTGCVSPPPA